jgi:pyridoxamine 5'-phosphate oxidase
MVLDEQLAEEYWKKRPISTRIGSKLSEQSAVIPSREYLIEKQKALEKIYENDGEEAITRPKHWFEFQSPLKILLFFRLGFALQPDR